MDTDGSHGSSPSSPIEKAAAAGAGSNCVKNEVTKHLDEVPILDEEDEVNDFIHTIMNDSLDTIYDDDELLSEIEVKNTADVLDGFLHDVPRFIEILKKTLAKGSGNEGNTQEIYKMSKIAAESDQGPPTVAIKANSTIVLDELDCAFRSLGASVPREKLRDIITTTKKSMLTDNPAQFVAVWGKKMNRWAKCEGGGSIGEAGCPCCYLCGQRLLPLGGGGGQPEMEHVVPCPVAYKSFPNMDTLRYYYPFILLNIGNNKEEYNDNTLKRVYHAKDFDSGIPKQSLRATMVERSNGLSMREYWDAFTPDNVILLKELYNAINCGIGDDTDDGDNTDELNKVKNAFKEFIKNNGPTGNIDVTEIKDGAFNRIFEYCFSVISIWLYELAYSHRWCNQTKWDVSLHDTASITALIGGNQDPRTKKSSRINTRWNQGATRDPILNEIIERPNMKKYFKDRLTSNTDKLPITQERVMKVWKKYDEAATKFPRVSVCNFFDDEDKIKLDEIKDVMWLNNLSRILRFTEIGLLSDLKYDEHASVVPRPVSGATSSDGSKKRERCDDKLKTPTVDELTETLNTNNKLLVKENETLTSLTDQLATLNGGDLSIGESKRKNRVENDIKESNRTLDALNSVIANLNEQISELNAATTQQSPLRPSVPVPSDRGPLTRRMTKGGARRTRRVRKSKRKSKRTRRARKSSRKAKTRRRVKK